MDLPQRVQWQTLKRANASFEYHIRSLLSTGNHIVRGCACSAVGDGWPFRYDAALDFDFDFLALDSDCVAGDVSRCRRAEDTAARDVEDGAVPRAGYFGPHNHSLRKWPAS